MSTFIEVFSIEKNTKVIINLDTILEIAPLKEGGCNLFFPDAAAVGGKNSMKVTDSYTLFKQFALETVTPDDIAARIQNMPKVSVEPYSREIPQEEKRGPGRPKSVMGNTTAGLE
jgi:hypothetical protein